MAGGVGYNETYTHKKRKEKETQTPYQLMPIKFKLKGDLEHLHELKQESSIVAIVIII